MVVHQLSQDSALPVFCKCLQLQKKHVKCKLYLDTNKWIKRILIITTLKNLNNMIFFHLKYKRNPNVTKSGNKHCKHRWSERQHLWSLSDLAVGMSYKDNKTLCEKVTVAGTKFQRQKKYKMTVKSPLGWSSMQELASWSENKDSGSAQTSLKKIGNDLKAFGTTVTKNTILWCNQLKFCRTCKPQEGNLKSASEHLNDSE